MQKGPLWGHERRTDWKPNCGSMRAQGQRTEAEPAENHGDGEERMGGFRGQETVRKGAGDWEAWG